MHFSKTALIFAVAIVFLTVGEGSPFNSGKSKLYSICVNSIEFLKFDDLKIFKLTKH
jgi:hypothetical protein